jgi:hypothetical protein
MNSTFVGVPPVGNAEPITSVRESYIRQLAPRPEPDQSESQAARHVIAALVEAGIDTFFGIPGGPVCAIFDAILETPGARLVESRHESAAAVEACGYNRRVEWPPSSRPRGPAPRIS